MTVVAKRLAVPAVVAGLLGGLLMIIMMIIVMGASGMGYASPLNLGMPAFVYTITPPLQMLPNLMGAMGISLPPAAMAQLASAIQSGHISAPMAHQLGAMLLSMHVPMAKVQMMGLLMTGHATNSTVSTLMSQMSPAARASVMAAMPVNSGHIVVGSILHFAFSAFLGVAFFAIIGAFAWFGPSMFRSKAAFMFFGVVGGALVYIINRFVFLPSVNPMMALVPQIAFFLAHLLFGLVVGTVFAMASTTVRWATHYRLHTDQSGYFQPERAG
ncbi:MAG: hypothetical protein ACYCS7_10180 [Acidimicrobiales bacterium]